MKLRKIPGYEDKVLTKEEIKALKKHMTEVAAGRIQENEKGGKKKNGKQL